MVERDDARIFEKRGFVLAADLGQSSDPTAIAILDHRHWQQVRVDGHVLASGDQIDVRHLQRLPLGLSYPEVVGEVQRLLARPPLRDGCDLVIDQTGVGAPVGDLFETHGLQPIRISITGSVDKAVCVGLNKWHVAKGLLISTLDSRLHCGDLRIAKDLGEAGALAEELKDFRRHVSAAGRFQYEARVGKHDDLVLAVAIGLWSIVGRPRPMPASFGTYGVITERSSHA